MSAPPLVFTRIAPVLAVQVFPVLCRLNLDSLCCLIQIRIYTAHPTTAAVSLEPVVVGTTTTRPATLERELITLHSRTSSHEGNTKNAIGH